MYENVAGELRSGYSSRTLEINNVPMPAPVPPPREWQSWKPCKPGCELKQILHQARDCGNGNTFLRRMNRYPINIKCV